MAPDAVSLMRARGARNSILAGARPRDRIRWRRPVRSLAKAACGRGGPYVMRARGARNSILAGARPRDRIRWRRPVRSLAKAACGRGGPYVFKSRHGLLVLGRMARTRADVRE